nr:uncharacterized protein LOC128675159 [Plodia interpunctella]
MAYSNYIVALLALLVIGTVCSQVSQGGPHESQGRSRRQATQDDPESPDSRIIASCENNTITSLSCYDCTTRLICKPNNIVLVKCRGAVKPYCNNGICSSVASPDCE